eukprot:SAG31_NODE_44413_length_263_cov_0.603659_1_plen_83_part_01
MAVNAATSVSKGGLGLEASADPIPCHHRPLKIPEKHTALVADLMRFVVHVDVDIESLPTLPNALAHAGLPVHSSAGAAFLQLL